MFDRLVEQFCEFDDFDQSVPLQYFNEELWRGRVEIPSVATQIAALEYRYIFREAGGSTIIEWGNDKQVDLAAYNTAELVLFDTWNYSGQIENAFFTKAFKDVLLKPKLNPSKARLLKTYTYEMRVKAPLLKEDEILCIGGSGSILGEWNTSKIIFNKGHVEHWLNGEKIVEFEAGSEEWNKKRTEGKWKDFPDYAKAKSGKIALQDHGNKAYYKNIRIRTL